MPISTIPIETILKKYYNSKSNLLVIYGWDWRINRFIRDFCEQSGTNKSLNANNLNPLSEYLVFDLSDISINKDKLDFLIKLLNRYNFKYMFF